MPLLFLSADHVRYAGMRLKLPRLDPPPSTASSFSRDYRPFQLRTNPDLNVTAGPSQSAFFYLTRAESSQRRSSRQVAQQQKRDVYRALSEQNLDPAGVLTHLANSVSPYARLFALAADELGCTAPPIRCHQVEDLERASAVESAKLEVQVQQLTQRLKRASTDATRARGLVRAHEEQLQQVNRDVERMSNLIAANGIDANQKPQPVAVAVDKGIDFRPAVPLDEAKYRALWAENVKLQQKLDDLKSQLGDVQARQMIAMRERARDLIAGRNRVLR
jgi:hypothetical protein